MITPPSSSSSSSSTTTVPLRLASGNGPITRLIQRTPPRDATPDEIPVIDVAGIFSSSQDDRLAVAQQIHVAATNTGFFYLTNHGIPTAVTDEAYAACLEFFRQDMKVKMQASATQSVYFNGYKSPRTQRINPFEGVDVRETFSWTYDPRLDPDVGDLDSIPPEVRQFLRVEPDAEDGGARFPWSKTGSVPSFAPAVLSYWRASLALARALVRSFALSLGLEEDFFDAKFSYPDASLALNYYPPLAPQTMDKEDEVSIGSHTDFQLFTILWQDSVGGLEVLNRAGQWIRARPIEGAVVVNIADYLERVTNGKYQSTVHRAVNRSGKERVSMPFFFGFNLNESCGVVDSCVGEDGVRLYEEIGCLEWVRRRVKAMHDTRAMDEDMAQNNIGREIS
ncbi:hypothetical protein N0V93_006303 [Gnomoniopsis smithogilvyi]|uniref:Fe2OG dioxygenase domain-containing protein n=1 Tax=Gnomoniopsis smithogilvyi TaxID=1191159 RepID=A0A9W8YN03_9PEZI|nr:hypothetical protein N0V93_006303 [Gnomoniopsis smithogilvyi]